VRTTTERLRAIGARTVLSVATTTSFASLWLVPRLASFRRLAPNIDVRISADSRFMDLQREGLDVAVRLCTAAYGGEGAVRLFGENVFPVAVPQIARLLRVPADLDRQVLLELDQHDRTPPWLSWRTWLEMVGLSDLRTQGFLRFSEYDQVVTAAYAGVGVALGRSELVREALASGKLVAPFKQEHSTARAYYAVSSPAAQGREEVRTFIAWLKREAKR
jgi:DNA-binding transcriptional LysR family regulator